MAKNGTYQMYFREHGSCSSGVRRQVVWAHKGNYLSLVGDGGEGLIQEVALELGLRVAGGCQEVGEGGQRTGRFHCLFPQEWANTGGEQAEVRLPKHPFPFKKERIWLFSFCAETTMRVHFRRLPHIHSFLLYTQNPRFVHGSNVAAKNFDFPGSHVAMWLSPDQ